MCRQCETKPVYEFTNKRKICNNCFIRYFQKKVFYTIRKFKMVDKDDIIGYCTQGCTLNQVGLRENIQKNIFTRGKNKGDFRSVVLENVLNMFGEKSPVKIVKLPTHSCLQISGSKPALSRFSTKTLVKKNISLDNFKKSSSALARGKSKKIDKIAIPLTIDLEANKIVNELIHGDSKNLKDVFPNNKKIIKPLYLFTDKEVLLYAKLKGLKFSKLKKEKEDKISLFVEGLEKKHPEVKRAVVNSWLELNNLE